ncbi:MAG: ABC transporter substrate-binding protein [Geminicoccaceae bacterium]
MADTNDKRTHPYLPKLVEQLEARKLERREFLRTATLLGMSAPVAYGLAGKVFGPSAFPPAFAQEPLKSGGIIKVSNRVPEVRNPHTFSWVYDSNIVRQHCEYMTYTDHDNITHPSLLESWEASDDLKTWTFKVRPGVTWNDGEALVADHLIWNIEHCLNKNTGSSVLGLMKGYMLDDNDELWDANAIEKIDDMTFRLNCSAPQLAVPEHFFHYPFLILHPDDGGEFDVGAKGTGAFEVYEIEVGKIVRLRAKDAYWGDGPYIDEIHFIDHGDDEAAQIGALSSQQVQGMYEASVTQYQVLKQIPHLELKEVTTAQTGVARARMGEGTPFDDPKVRKAMRLALDTGQLLQIGHLNIGAPGEHHHVAPIHPEYAKLPFMHQDIDGAKALLAEAGYPDGFEIEIACKKDPAWELITVQACVEMWKQAGINVNINVLPSAQFWEVWDKVPFGFTSWTHRPLGVMVLGLAYRSGVPWNESNFSDEEFDALLLEAEGTLDVDARREIMEKIEIIMQERGPIALPLWRGLFSFWATSVKGFRHHPTSYIFGNQMWLEEA